MSDEKYITTAVALVIVIFLLSSLTYCSVDEYYDDLSEGRYLEKGCVRAQQIGSVSTFWKCPETGEAGE